MVFVWFFSLPAPRFIFCITVSMGMLKVMYWPSIWCWLISVKKMVKRKEKVREEGKISLKQETLYHKG